MDERISVTFITKNRQGFFLQAFSSLLSQTFKDFDIIIIDDSDEPVQDKEETRFLVEIAKHKGHGIKFITGENLGITQAWQRGLEESSCEFGYRMEDDIYIMPDYLENLYNAIIKDKNIAAVGGLSPNIFHHATINDKQFINDFYMEGENIIPEDKQCCLILDPKPLYYVQHLHGLFVYRKSLVQNVGGFATWMSPKGHRDETDLTLRLYRAGYKLVVIPTAILFHAEAPQGGSRDRSPLERNQMNQMDEAIFQERVKSWMSNEPKLELNIRK